MKVILWVLVDNGGRICYSGHTREIVENAQDLSDYYKKCDIVKLEGESNV